jgi:hypothetical protein
LYHVYWYMSQLISTISWLNYWISRLFYSCDLLGYNLHLRSTCHHFTPFLIFIVILNPFCDCFVVCGSS